MLHIRALEWSGGVSSRGVENGFLKKSAKGDRRDDIKANAWRGILQEKGKGGK